jgi:nucleotide-binding universal stress UspA family protein
MIMTSTAATCQTSSDVSRPRIVVGVDGSERSMRALEWAATEAKLRGAVLQVVHVDFARHEAVEALAPDMLTTERSVLEQAVTRAQALEKDIMVSGRLCEPPADKALIEMSEGADMLVVGSRGLSGLKERVSGSVSNECAHRCRCPVVIVHAPGDFGPKIASRRSVTFEHQNTRPHLAPRAVNDTGVDSASRHSRPCHPEARAQDYDASAVSLAGSSDNDNR